MLLSSLAHYPAYAECLSSIMDTKNMHVPSIERLQDLVILVFKLFDFLYFLYFITSKTRRL